MLDVFVFKGPRQESTFASFLSPGRVRACVAPDSAERWAGGHPSRGHDRQRVHAGEGRYRGCSGYALVRSGAAVGAAQHRYNMPR
jgi:hypothetical protein